MSSVTFDNPPGSGWPRQSLPFHSSPHGRPTNKGPYASRTRRTRGAASIVLLPADTLASHSGRPQPQGARPRYSRKEHAAKTRAPPFQKPSLHCLNSPVRAEATPHPLSRQPLLVSNWAGTDGIAPHVPAPTRAAEVSSHGTGNQGFGGGERTVFCERGLHRAVLMRVAREGLLISTRLLLCLGGRWPEQAGKGPRPNAARPSPQA